MTTESAAHQSTHSAGSPVLRLRAPVVLPCDVACSVVRDGVVDVELAGSQPGRIRYTGPRDQAPELPADSQIQDHSGILLPGLINTHAHSPMTLLRGLGADLPLLRWLHEAIWPAESRLRPRDVRAGMRLGCWEMLRSGVTTSAEMYFPGEALVEAALSVGSRMLLAPAVIDTPDLAGLGSWQEMLDGISRWIDADGLRFGAGERIELCYGPHSAYTLAPEALEAVGTAAQQRGALLQIHVAESAEEDATQREQYGSVPLLLEKLGILEGRVIAAHSVHLSQEDIALFAARGVGVAHCPGSNAKLASGMAPFVELQAAGVHVGLGTDGPSSNDDLELWQEIQLSAMLARLSTGDAGAVLASTALLAATREGAAALGRNDLGSLEAGRWADIVHLDVDQPAFATGLDVPDSELLSNLVWAGGSRCVADVWVAGEQVLTAKELAQADSGEILAEARASSHYVRYM